MEIRSFSAAQNYTAMRAATQPSSIENVFQNAARDFAASLAKAESTAMSAMVGEADPHALVQALTQSELAVETAVTVRNKVVEAYQEILRMPV